jgi:deazaflavin-dependent oxidoreductase (nitroreductase family)
MPLPDRLPRWLKLINPLVVRLNRWGLTVGTMHVLTVRGRKTGKPYSTPVSLVTIDRQRYAVSLPWVSWVKNARASGEGVLERGPRKEQVHLVELAPEERVPVVRAFPVQVPRGAAFFHLPPDPDAFERVAPHLTAFRVESVGVDGAEGRDRGSPGDHEGATPP